jgi:hypothetical protein
MQDCYFLQGMAVGCVAVGGLFWPFQRYQFAKRGMEILGLLTIVLMIASPVYTWRQGHWHFGPYWTPVQIIGSDGKHLDGCTNYESTESPVVWWCGYLVLGGSIAAICWALRGLMRSQAGYAARWQAIETFKRDVTASSLLPPAERATAQARLNAAFDDLERFCLSRPSERQKKGGARGH